MSKELTKRWISPSAWFTHPSVHVYELWKEWK